MTLIMPQRKLLGPRGGGITYSYEGSYFAEVASTTVTYTSAPLGTAAADRTIVVALGSRKGEKSGAGFLTCTIGGTSATKLVEEVGAGDAMTAIYSLDVAAGTSADIVFTTTDNSDESLIAVWAVYGHSTYTTDSDQNSATTALSCSLNVSTDDVAIGAHFTDSDANPVDVTISGVDTDGTGGTNGVAGHAAWGSLQITADETPRAFGGTHSTSSKHSMCVAVFSA